MIMIGDDGERHDAGEGEKMVNLIIEGFVRDCFGGFCEGKLEWKIDRMCE
jgi:hypothetical protein